MKKKIIFLLIGLWLCAVSSIQAQPIKWNGNEKKLEIGQQVTILEDAAGALTFEQASSAAFSNQYKPSTTPNLILGYTLSVFWVKFSLDNTIAAPLLLEVTQAGLPVCDLYYKDDSNKVVCYKAGSNTEFKDRVIKSSFQVFPLLSGQRDYYLRLTTNSGPIPLRIYTRVEYDEKSIYLKFVYGIYLGLMLFVFLSNMFFFFSMRQSLYLFNAIMVLIFITYSAVVVDGFIVYFFNKVDMLFWYTVIPCFGVTLQTLYCLWFLEVKKHRPLIYKFTIWAIILFFAWWIVEFFLPFPIKQPINTLHSLLCFFIMGYIGVAVGRSGNRFGYLFALTYFAYFLLVLAEAAYINVGKPTYILGFSYSGWATVMEALALSFLLTQRFEAEKEEVLQKESEAQLRLMEKTLENERIVRNQNVMWNKK